LSAAATFASDSAPAFALLGCDFSSSPTRRKPIVIAHGRLTGLRVQHERLERLESLDAFSHFLNQPEPWLGAFDLPFGLPRELVEHLAWPTDWERCVAHFTGLKRAQIRETFKAFCDARPVGSKFAHRATDRPAQSSPSMKWVNPPVAYMLHAGVPRLLAAGVHFPGLQPALPAAQHIALEAYPGLLAREVLGARSYKSDDKAKQTAERLIARKDLITALELGQSKLQLRLKLTHAQRDMLIEDGSGDSLDAVLCLMQAAWAQVQRSNGNALYGLPIDMDPLEGWILTA
jgi:hypothetical protein